MDPDRWEFANEWFLRGQKHLLKNIVRRKQSSRISSSFFQGKHEELEDEALATEIARLKEEQKSLEEEIQGMNKRLETTEKRPQQMMAFLSRVVEDPDVLSRIMLEKERWQLGAKKPRLISSAATTATTSSSSSSGMAVKTEFEEEEAPVGPVISSSPEIENFCQPPPTEEMIGGTTTSSDWHTIIGTGRPRITQQAYHWNAVPRPLTAVGSNRMDNNAAMSARGGGMYSGCENSKGETSYVKEMAAESSPPPPYPFSLLEGGF